MRPISQIFANLLLHVLLSLWAFNRIGRENDAMRMRARKVPASAVNARIHRTWAERLRKPVVIAVLFLALQLTHSEPALAMTMVRVYQNGVYLGCTIYYNILEEWLFGWRDETVSPAVIEESGCSDPYRVGNYVYVSSQEVGDFNHLGTEILSSFTPPVERNPNGTFLTPAFGATDIESGTQAGVGVGVHLNDWLSLDFGLTAGSGTASRISDLPLAREEAHFRLYGASLAARIYFLQMPLARVQPWLSGGVRGLAMRPTDGSYTTFNAERDLPGRRFQPSSATDFLSGAGIDVHLTDLLGVTLSGEHGFRTGWRAGANLTFSWSSTRPTPATPQREVSPR